MNEDEASPELLSRFKDAVLAYYASGNVSSPLLLSRFGQLNAPLREKLVEAYGSLGEAVKAAGEQELLLMRSAPSKSGSEIVLAPENQEFVDKLIAERMSQTLSAEQTMRQLPLSMQVAFCTRAESGQQVALELTPPFKYHKLPSDEAVPQSMATIEDRFRRPEINLRTASSKQKRLLWAVISEWAAAKSLDLSLFLQDGSARSGENALSRLLAAQPRAILSKLIIPGDIAEILQKHD